MKRIAGLMMCCCCAVAWGEEREYLNYDEFLRHVESGLILSVEISEYSGITGEMRVDDGVQGFRSYGRVGTANDPLLLRLLREHDVAVTLQPERNSGFGGGRYMLFSMLTMFGVPLVLVAFAVALYIKLNQVLANQRLLLGALVQPVRGSDVPDGSGAAPPLER